MADRVTINVSGRRFETLLSTLSRRPRSLLGDDQRRAPFWDAARSEFFFDRSSSSFESILLVYQTNGEPRRPAGVSADTFCDDLRFFGLSEETEQLATVTNDAARPLSGLRATIDNIVGNPVLAIVSAIITVVSMVLYAVATLPWMQSYSGSVTQLVLVFLELACVLVMFAEAVALTVTNRWQRCNLRGVLLVIDLLSCVLSFMSAILYILDHGQHNLVVHAIGYLARLLRLFRVLRLIQSTRSGRLLLSAAAAAAPACGVLLAVWLSTAVFFAILLLWADRGIEYASIISLSEALYMTVITMTTVGYGDFVPVTSFAKAVGCICAYAGCVLAALPAGLLVVKFVQLCAAEQPRLPAGKPAQRDEILCTPM